MPLIQTHDTCKTHTCYFYLDCIMSIDNELYDGSEVALAQSDLKYYSIEATQTKNNVLWAYNVLAVLDSTVNYTDSIIAFLANETDVHSRKQLIATYYAIGDYSNASQYLTALPQTTDELVQFKAYYDLLIAIADDERNIYQLNSEEIVVLQSIAVTQTSAALAAQGILTLVNGEVYNGIIERVQEEEAMLTTAKTENSNNTKNFTSDFTTNVYPNPANNEVNIALNSQKSYERGEIHVTDIAGKTHITRTFSMAEKRLALPIKHLADGVYFVHVFIDNSLVSVNRVVVHH